MGRAPCSEDTEGLKKGAWTAEEDEKLVSFIRKNKGHGSWRTLPKLAGLERCGKSCRLRWTNYLRPNIKRGNFSAEEERIIIQLHAIMGNKWSSIASHLPGRTDNEVKNHWNTHLKKRLTKMGIDPTTHLPLQFITPHNQDAANYYALLNNHYQPNFHNFEDWRVAWLQRSLQQVDPTALACQLAQWELARLEAEARMQIAASSHNYVSWLQTVQQSCQAAIPGDGGHNSILQALNLQQLHATLAASNSSFAHPTAPLQASAYCEASEEQQLLRQLNTLPDNYDENQHFATCSDLINRHEGTSGSGIPHASEGPVYTSTACSMTTPETCSSEGTSHELLCELPDLLSANAEMLPALNIHDVPLTSPPAEHDAHEVHDSYWNKMLDLLGPPSCTLMDA